MTEKKKGMIEKYKDDSRSHTKRMCGAITENRNYQELYSISKAVKRCDGDNLIIGALGLCVGLIIWIFTVLWPFLMSGRFHMGVGAAIGICLIFVGIAYYLGSFRVLHPISKYVSIEKDARIYEILKVRDEDVTLIEDADSENPTETDE